MSLRFSLSYVFWQYLGSMLPWCSILAASLDCPVYFSSSLSSSFSRLGVVSFFLPMVTAPCCMLSYYCLFCRNWHWHYFLSFSSPSYISCLHLRVRWLYVLLFFPFAVAFVWIFCYECFHLSGSPIPLSACQQSQSHLSPDWHFLLSACMLSEVYHRIYSSFACSVNGC